jgi:hypothetical protein
VKSHSTVIIPFADCVIVVSLLNCAEFSSRLSEVAQTLDTIPGVSSWPVVAGSASVGLLARSSSGVAPGLISFLPKDLSSAPSQAFISPDRYKHSLGRLVQSAQACQPSR